MDVDKQLHGDGRNILFGISSTSTKDLTQQRNSLKELGLKRLTPREHFFVAICRDISLVLILKNCFVFWTKWYQMVTSEKGHSSFTSVWATEFFLAGIWCMVSGLLSYSILDGLMARWMVMYTVQAAIIRILSMSLLIIVLVELLNYMFNNSSNEFCLAAWIIISCVLTFVYIIQNYITSNLRLNEILLQDERNKEDMGLDTDDTTGDGSQDLPSSAAASSTAFDPNYRIPPPPSASLHRRNNDSSQHLRHGSRSQSQLGEAESKKPERPRRTVDLYNLTVFAVVPIGVASFITMCGLVRLVVILRLEIGLKLSQLLPK
ncbi:DEKNAAC104551 [Brettanomyces naardenensis]|uniref:DEKNAAC104551 n=1 Tax=Brettanomyces naardenensis TaxID=13370 RepID=A0A448YRP5_BRENA|nr:DEKNAAC104551 [Brettanomyces naardenensis]